MVSQRAARATSRLIPVVVLLIALESYVPADERKLYSCLIGVGCFGYLILTYLVWYSLSCPRCGGSFFRKDGFVHPMTSRCCQCDLRLWERCEP